MKLFASSKAKFKRIERKGKGEPAVIKEETKGIEIGEIVGKLNKEDLQNDAEK